MLTSMPVHDGSSRPYHTIHAEMTALATLPGGVTRSFRNDGGHLVSPETGLSPAVNAATAVCP